MPGHANLAVAPKALRSLYGASDRLKANTAKAHIGSGSDRPQVVYTPQVVVDALATLWPEGIQLDPCSGPDSIVPARIQWFGEQVPTGRFKRTGEPILKWTGPGLSGEWPERTYINPPYCDLQDWLAVAVDKGILSAGGELAFLIPLRTSRRWFREYLGHTTRVCLLDPLVFEGYEQSFPAPLVLAYHGDRDLDSACKGLGQCCTISF